MPFGVPTGRYITFVATAMITMFVGAQTVHIYYRPLDDLDAYIEKAKKEKNKMK
ncbi:protein brawnin [Coccinella septempunctata]|uniref:protein brawnin n=1 Tax=Coccinella septempunctata TaxID=41139 RepID=UPI001D064BB5|nr:protein brawnin [Coccinella septempunctata]